MNLVIDRIEGDFAVVEFDGQPFDLPVAALPPGVGEGDRLVLLAAPASPPAGQGLDPGALERWEAESNLADAIEL